MDLCWGDDEPTFGWLTFVPIAILIWYKFDFRSHKLYYNNIVRSCTSDNRRDTLLREEQRACGSRLCKHRRVRDF